MESLNGLGYPLTLVLSHGEERKFIFSPLAGEIRVRGKVLNPKSHPHLPPLPSRERRDENDG